MGRMPFNHKTVGNGQEKTWIKDPSLPNSAVIFLEEGAVQLTQTYSAPTPGATIAQATWNGVTMVGELDTIELRDADGRTIARGTRDTGLGEV